MSTARSKTPLSTVWDGWILGERGRWRVWLSEGAEAVIQEAASTAHPKETGGVLIGVLAGSRPWVTHAVHAPSPTSTGTSYEIPAGARRKAVERERRVDPRVGYLGDWHSHPADVDPSRCDETTMAYVAEDPRADCARPLLFVLRRAGDDYWVDARQWMGRSLRELQVLQAGALAVGARARPPRRRTVRKIAKSLRGRR